MIRWVVALALACAPVVDGPVEQQRAVDRDDGDQLAAQLAQLPGAVRADVTLHRAMHDPLDGRVVPASAAVLVVVDDKADRNAIADAATRLTHATAPDIPAPAVVVELGAVRPELTTVGPFHVESGSKSKLKVTLAVLLGAVLALAAMIAWRRRSPA